MQRALVGQSRLAGRRPAPRDCRFEYRAGRKRSIPSQHSDDSGRVVPGGIRAGPVRGGNARHDDGWLSARRCGGEGSCENRPLRGDAGGRLAGGRQQLTRCRTDRSRHGAWRTERMRRQSRLLQHPAARDQTLCQRYLLAVNTPYLGRRQPAYPVEGSASVAGVRRFSCYVSSSDRPRSSLYSRWRQHPAQSAPQSPASRDCGGRRRHRGRKSHTSASRSRQRGSHDNGPGIQRHERESAGAAEQLLQTPFTIS